MGKVIWILNHYASHLESRHLELAKVFADNGYTVAVITSSFHHGKHDYIFDEKYTVEERNKNVFFIYLRSKPAYHSNGGNRVLNMIDFCCQIRKNANSICKLTGKPSCIIGSSAHPFVWETSYSLSRQYHTKFIAEFRDIWPLSLVEVQGVSPNHPFVKLLSAVEKRAYKRADAIVGTMPYAYLHVSEELGFPKEKVHWIPNGINTSKVDAILQGNDSLPFELNQYLCEKWCCVYVGSIVKSECIDFMLDAWKIIGNPQLFFAIVGEGGEKERIQKRIIEEKIDNVKMFPAVRPDEVPLVLSKANCCVAALEFGSLGQYGLSKYKLNDYLYSGKPTVFACDSPNIVKDAGHFSIPAGNIKQLADTIECISRLDCEQLEELEEKGKDSIRSTFDYTVVGEKYLSIIESL